MTATAPIVVTGFEPFGGESVNPSQLIVERFPDHIAGRALVRTVLPVDPVKGILAAFDVIDAHQPAAVLSLGQSGFPLVQIEGVFVNLFHPAAECPGEPVVPGGPDGYFATLDMRHLILAAAKAGQPVCGSMTAGTYVCNALGYQIVHRYGATVPSTFVHLPYLPEQRPGDEKAMPLEVQIDAVLAILHAVVEQLESHPA